MDFDANDAYLLEKIAMAEAESEDTEGKALVMLVVSEPGMGYKIPGHDRRSDHAGRSIHTGEQWQI